MLEFLVIGCPISSILVFQPSLLHYLDGCQSYWSNNNKSLESILDSAFFISSRCIIEEGTILRRRVGFSGKQLHNTCFGTGYTKSI